MCCPLGRALMAWKSWWVLVAIRINLTSNRLFCIANNSVLTDDRIYSLPHFLVSSSNLIWHYGDMLFEWLQNMSEKTNREKSQDLFLTLTFCWISSSSFISSIFSMSCLAYRAFRLVTRASHVASSSSSSFGSIHCRLGLLWKKE